MQWTEDPSGWAVADRVGVAHIAGRYHFGDDDSDLLGEGADEILRLGARVFKGWLSDDPATVYRFGRPCPPVTSLVDLVSTPAYRDLFDRPFSTYVFEVFQFGPPRHYWLDRDDAALFAEETRQVEVLASHLLTTYAGTGKTFVFQNWEGDWAVRGHSDADRLPERRAYDGLVRWMDARQAGVDRARDAAGDCGARVLNALEVNMLAAALDGRPCVATEAVPRTACDLYAYSAWDTTLEPERFGAAIDLLGELAPHRGTVQGSNVFIGEVGCAEVDHGSTRAAAVVDAALDVALGRGCPWILYWQLYDDSCDGPDGCQGFWLVRRDGTRAAAYDVLAGRLSGRRPS